MRVDFNLSPKTPSTDVCLRQVFANGKLSGDGEFTKKCSNWMMNRFHVPHVLLTTSGSHALEMAARLCDLSPGDEVIMPSYTFSSTANAFVAVGARIVFVDIRPDTLNLNEEIIEAAITPRTRVIVPVHYAGIACEMDRISEIARKYNLLVVEDAAQGVMSTYKGKALGTLSDFGCFSFHETKNYSMGEGGALLFHDAKYLEKAEIMREKGTDRSKFFRKQIDKYSWVNWGSSYLPSELNAAYLWSQLEYADEINADRIDTWNRYYESLLPLADEGRIKLPHVPEHCIHNAHMFYIKAKDLKERTQLLDFLKEAGIGAIFHYIPLHSSKAGLQFSTFFQDDKYTTAESERIVRLPLYYRIEPNAVEYVVSKVFEYYDSVSGVVEFQ